MKRRMLICVAVLLIAPMTYGQTTLLTEDFETDGEGSRYTSNHFDNACHDFFERYMNGGGNCITNEPTNVNGTYYWAGEDLDVASGGVGMVTLNAVNVAGSSLEMMVHLAIGRPNDFRFEPADELLFQYNMDGGGWNTFAAFYGSNDGSGSGNLVQDADLDGNYDVGGAEISSSDFTNWTFSIPATGNSVQVRFISGQDQGTEETLVDYIRIIGTVLPVELDRFYLQKTDDNFVKINWQTASEQSNDFFTIERSDNGINWSELAKIDGQGNSDLPFEYHYVDDLPLTGTSYYRLKQTDFDGSFTYSTIESIRLTTDYESQIFIHPNPASHELIISGDKREWTDLDLINANGQSVFNQINVLEISTTRVKIDISSLTPGLYFVRTRSNWNKVVLF